MSNWYIMTLGLVFVLGLILGFYAMRLYYLDACLDRGGAWDSDRTMCLRYVPREEEW
jgi:hypothetical protein